MVPSCFIEIQVVLTARVDNDSIHAGRSACADSRPRVEAELPSHNCCGIVAHS
jgi:hypothetical protein